jgi:hypothetical protein
MSAATPNRSLWRNLTGRPARPWRLAGVLRPTALIAAAVAANAAVTALRSPGQAIRGELAGAAAELASRVGPQPTEAATRAIRAHFRLHAATLDTRFWPQVSATLHHLDRATCSDAIALDHRIEGLVVIELERYRSDRDCSDDNDMTWWILP